MSPEEAFQAGQPEISEASQEELPKLPDVPGFQPGDPEEIKGLLAAIVLVSLPGTCAERRRLLLEQLLTALRPQVLRPESRRIFIERAAGLGIAEVAVGLIESGGPRLALLASNLLIEFTFSSDVGARVVLGVFKRIAACFKRHVFRLPLNWEALPFLESAVLLCTNMAALCNVCHELLLPLVQPVCLEIIKSPLASEDLRSHTITMLANLSMTVAKELREMRVADVLLALVLEENGVQGRSVAESVVVYLHSETRSVEVDRLMDAGFVGSYCVPLMEATLRGEEFRDMYPYLMYSGAVFQSLARCREYAERLAADRRVLPLLLQATMGCPGLMAMQSDLEGRSLALQALSSLAGFGLWPQPGDEDYEEARKFLEQQLPRLLADPHANTRRAAVELWARFNGAAVRLLQEMGLRVSALPTDCWRLQVLPFLYPFLAPGGCSQGAPWAGT